MDETPGQALAQAAANLYAEIARRYEQLLASGKHHEAVFVLRRLTGAQEELALALVMLKANT